MPFSPVPSEIKPVAHLMKLADEHDQRNVVVAYWARMAACRLALKMVPGKKSPEFTTLLNEILNWLEKAKEEHRSNEGICSETTAQALIEEYALNLFSHAEKQDAAEIFNKFSMQVARKMARNPLKTLSKLITSRRRHLKNTVKLFYTAGMLFDVLEQFGLSEDLHEKQKYAKWKAAYIHNCLKSGEKPQPGPPNSGNEENNMVHISELPEEEQLRLLEEKRRLQEEQDRKRREEEEELNRLSNFAGNNTPGAAGNMPGLNNDGFQFPKYSPISPNIPQQPGSITPSTPQASGPTTPAPSGPTTYNLPTPTNYGMPPNTQIQLTTEQIQRAQKLTKYATSALNYDDVKTAVENLQKALNLLQFGKE